MVIVGRLARREVLVGLGVSGLSAACATPPEAPEPTVPVPVGAKFEFDIPGGMIEYYEFAPASALLAAGAGNIRLRFQMEQANRNDQWSSIIGFEFGDRTLEKRLNVDFIDRGRAQTLIVSPRFFESRGSSGKTEFSTPLQNRSKNEIFEVDFAVSAAETTFRVGGQRDAIPISHKVERFVIHVSGVKGWAEFLSPTA